MSTKVSVLACTLCVGLVTWWFAWPGLSKALPPVVMLAQSDCDLNRQLCQQQLPDGSRLYFAIEPRPISADAPFRLQAELDGGKAVSMEIMFSGVEMQMGDFPLHLALGEGVFSGETTLPVCIRGEMAWRLELSVRTASNRYVLPFQFVVGEASPP